MELGKYRGSLRGEQEWIWEQRMWIHRRENSRRKTQAHSGRIFNVLPHGVQGKPFPGSSHKTLSKSSTFQELPRKIRSLLQSANIIENSNYKAQGSMSINERIN